MNIAMLQQEHDKANEEYSLAKNTLLKGPEPHIEPWKYVSNHRINLLVDALSQINPVHIAEAPSYVQAIDCFVSFFDDVVLECALIANRRKEVEEHILNLCKEALAEPTKTRTRNNDDEHVVCTLIDGVLIHEAPIKARYGTISAALTHETNPLRLGYTFYQTFCEKYPEAIEITIFKYLKAEEEVRHFLSLGKFTEANDALARLFSLDYYTPEQFILMSLNTFYSGNSQDVAKSLVLGLEKFPHNRRLIQLKESLEDM